MGGYQLHGPGGKEGQRCQEGERRAGAGANGVLGGVSYQIDRLASIHFCLAAFCSTLCSACTFLCSPPLQTYFLICISTCNVHPFSSFSLLILTQKPFPPSHHIHPIHPLGSHRPIGQGKQRGDLGHHGPFRYVRMWGLGAKWRDRGCLFAFCLL